MALHFLPEKMRLSPSQPRKNTIIHFVDTKYLLEKIILKVKTSLCQFSSSDVDKHDFHNPMLFFYTCVYCFGKQSFYFLKSPGHVSVSQQRLVCLKILFLTIWKLPNQKPTKAGSGFSLHNPMTCQLTWKNVNYEGPELTIRGHAFEKIIERIGSAINAFVWKSKIPHKFRWTMKMATFYWHLFTPYEKKHSSK